MLTHLWIYLYIQKEISSILLSEVNGFMNPQKDENIISRIRACVPENEDSEEIII